MNGICECGHVAADHNGPINDCQARCLCDHCPDDTGNDCWCAGFRAKEPTQFFPPGRPYFGPDLAQVHDLIRQHCGPYEAREEFAACHNHDPLIAGGQCTLPVGARLTSEFSELSQRVKKLEKFVTSDRFDELDGYERTDLLQQLRHMRAYHEVLLRRVGRQANNA